MTTPASSIRPRNLHLAPFETGRRAMDIATPTALPIIRYDDLNVHTIVHDVSLDSFEKS
ncbi:hypothetical protein AXF42_Ash014496 [Apostasia shenzhenica]|uniref:Uncharacterized protein n=1 Tax=Apostasia shenzhenica TaxID=1088818 RepID=A0A2H9ZWN2_9ASPA|nr:hypothetical protein AXF42_Ash014496 [Apostasia shenzhenica]